MKNEPIKGSDRRETNEENSREKRKGLTLKIEDKHEKLFANGYDK